MHSRLEPGDWPEPEQQDPIQNMATQNITVQVPLLSEACHTPESSRQWFAVSVRSRHEKVVTQFLNQKGYETFLPLYTRRHQYARRIREFDLPLFPGYLFCRCDSSAYLSVLTTPGVLRLMGAGRTPIAVDNDEITAIRRAIQADVPLAPHPYWNAGQKARVAFGALMGIEGLVIDARSPMRLLLSVSLLQRSVLLEIESGRVDLIEQAPASKCQAAGE
jgi:transcription antitermination factor NusG